MESSVYEDGTSAYNPSISTTSSNFTHEPPPSYKCSRLQAVCRVRFCLCLVQCFVGITVICVGLYLRIHTPSLNPRDTAYWSGIILLVSGLLNLYLCASGFQDISKVGKRKLLTITSAVCSCAAVFLCLTVAIFPAIAVTRLDLYRSCDQETGHCTCILVENQTRVLYEYKHNDSCFYLRLTLLSCLTILSCCNVIGSLSCLWFVVLIWKSRYS